MGSETERIQAIYRESVTAGEPTAGQPTGPADGGQPTPDRVVQVGQGYLRAKYMLIGLELGVFQAAGTGGLTLEALAGACGTPVRTMRVLCDALVLWGLLEPDGDRLRNAPDAEAFLTGRGALDLRPMFRYFDRVSYPTWVNAAEAFRTGEGVRGQLTEEQTRIYEESVAFATLPAATALPGVYDFGGHRHLLDVGGGAGMFLSTALQANPGLSGTLLELPEVVEQVREQVQAGPAGDRIRLVAADMFTDPIPTGWDVALLASIIHLFPPEPNQVLLRRLREAAPDGARLLVVDWYTGPETPAATILLSGEWLTISGGCAYPVDEVDGWLKETGWRRTDHLELAPPTTILVAETA